MQSGMQEKLSYSLSRWTDVPAGKWPWFQEAMRTGHMVAFDPRTAIPGKWSLSPDDVLGLIFWTKNPKNLIDNADLLREYKVRIHVTATGWEEVEKGAPRLQEAAHLLTRTAETFGPENVRWRFSPVPIVPNTVERFFSISESAGAAGIQEVYLSFLQPNDRIPETRTPEKRLDILREIGSVAQSHGLHVYLCNEDRLLEGHEVPNVSSGICAPSEGFGELTEDCGCALSVDPFTQNEACVYGCGYCYASDATVSIRKRNTTRLRVL